MVPILIAVFVLNLLCSSIQLLPVVTAPVTLPRRHLNLSEYNGYAFGVFGVCDLIEDKCSKIRLGYSDLNLTRTTAQPADYVGDFLPSDTIRSVSQLLIMHLIAFAASELSAISIAVLLLVQAYYHWGPQKLPKLCDSPDQGPPDVTPYLNVSFGLSLLSFFSTLLAFLADILLFTPHLGVLIWIQAIPIVVFSVIVTILCFMRRTVSWKLKVQRYSSDNTFSHTGPRAYLRGRENSDCTSDDGFYVFTTGAITEVPTELEPNKRERTSSGVRDSHAGSELEITDPEDIADSGSYYSVVGFEEDIPLQFMHPPANNIQRTQNDPEYS